MKRIISLLLMLVSMSAAVWAQCDEGQGCSITISGTDSYGDGWNGASIAIWQDTNLLGLFTVNGSNTTQTFPACAGEVSFVWTSGSYNSECAFVITDSLGVQLYVCDNASLLSGTFCTTIACPSCLPPLQMTATTTPDSAYIGWADNSDASGWIYQYTTATYPTGSWTYTTDSSIVLSGLNPNTTYNLFACTICDVDDTSAVSQLTFVTQCGDMVVPFTEDFENNGAFPACWTLWEHTSYTSYGYTSYYPVIYNYSSHGGMYHIEMYSDYGPNSIISPKVFLPANEVEVQFWGYGNSAVVSVGYTTTDDSATAVFNLVQNVALNDDWQLYTVSFDNLTITDSIYVVIRVSNNAYYTYSHIDDITIRRHSTCPLVDSLHVVSTASGQITFGWSSGTASAWEIAYGPVGFDPDFDTTRVLMSTNPFTLTGLSDSLTYDFYVRSVCGTERGYWSLPVTERPNVFNMSVDGMGPGVLYTCGMSVADPGGVSGDVAYYTSGSVVIFPDDSTMTVGLRGYAVLGSMNLKIYEGVGTGGRLLADLTGTRNNVSVTSSIGPITLQLNSSYYSAEGFLFQTFCSPLPTCTDVYDVDVSNITGNSALVSWNYAEFTTPDFFTIRVIDTATSVELDFTVPDSVRSYTVTGLEQLTNYILVIQTSCDNGDTSNNVFATFRTKCLSGGEIMVGDPNTSSTTYNMPIYTGYEYSLTQQLFDSTEVAGFDTIFGVMFYKSSGGSSTRMLDVYVDTTSLTSYNSVSDFQTQDLAHRCYSGSYTIVDGLNEIPFTTPFAYDGNGKSIIITFVDKSGSYGSTAYCQVHYTTNMKALYGYDYTGEIDPTSPTCLTSLSWGAGVTNSRNNITFLTPCGDASCIAPSVTVASSDSGSVTLSWVPGLYESDWSVEYRTLDDTSWQVHNYATSLDTAVISGLVPATNYVFRISSLCGDTSASAIITASTRCAPNRTIPFVEDFEAFSGSSDYDDLQQCWYRYTNYPNDYGTYYYPYVYSWYSHSGSNSMYFVSSPYDYYSQLVLPEMAASIDTLRLSFYMMGTYTDYYTYKVQVGVMTDPNNISTFVMVDTAVLSVSDYEWQYFEMELDNYMGNGKYIAIRTDPNVSYYLYIDDITVDYINPCKRVLDPVAYNATVNSITLSFTDTNNVGSYTIVYGTSDDLANATDTVLSTTTSVLLSGLTPATQYHAWVRTNCGGIVSDWVEFPAFGTRCYPIVVNDSIEYYTDFEEGLDNCMAQVRISGRTDWMGTTTSSNPSGAYSGGHIAQYYDMGHEGVSMLLLPNFDFSNLSRDAELTFWHAQFASSGYQDELQVLYRTNDTAQWTVIASFTQELTSWTQHFVLLPNSVNNSCYQIALQAFGNMGYGVKIDDISVHASPTCMRPFNITVSNVTDESAVLSWTGNSDAYTVSYRKTGSWSWHSVTTDNPSVVLTGLTNLTNYEVRVKGDCSRFDHSTWSESVTFNTNACVIPISHYNYDTTNYTHALSNNSPAITYYNYTYSEVLVDSADLAGLTDIIGFGFFPTNLNTRNAFGDCDIYFGTTTDTALNSFYYDTTFVHVYHGSLNFAAAGWQYFRLDTTYVYNGHTNLIVGIKRHGSTTNYGEDSRFAGHTTNCVKSRSVYNYEPINLGTVNFQPSYYISSDTVSPNYAFLACAPYCYAPEITATAVTTGSAFIGWTADGVEAEVSYREASADEWSDPVAVSAYNYTFTGLNHSTTYQLRVRQNCTADTLGFSNWTYATVTTDPICSIPTEVQVTDITNARATISWSAPATDDLWEVHVWGGDYDQTYRTNNTSTTVRGLQPGKHYSAEVRTFCGPGHRTLGDYSDAVEFTTPICGPVAGLHGEAYGNSVRLAWAPGINNTSFWEIQYGRAGYIENEVLGTVISPDTAFTIRNLVPNFTYGFRVRSLCGAAWESDWSTGELVITTGNTIGIDDVDARFLCTIYPNPATDATTITVSGVEGRITITIVDMNGRTVASEAINCSADCKKQMNVSGLGQGAYFVRIVGDNVNSVRKLVIK